MQLAPTDKRFKAKVRRVIKGFGRAKAVQMFGPEIVARLESGSRAKPRRVLRGQVAGYPAHRRLGRKLLTECVLEAEVRAAKGRKAAREADDASEAGEAQP